MRTNLLDDNLPSRGGDALIRALAAAALSASALAGTALALALAAPSTAHAETLTPLRTSAFTLAAAPRSAFGPSLDAAGPDNLAVRLVPPAPAGRHSATEQFRLEADDSGVATVYHVHDYDLRLEAGTVFTRTVAGPGQTPGSTMRGRLTGRVVTRF